MTEIEELVLEASDLDGQRCLDFDEDCDGVPCKTTCWLYQPERGYCPYLRGQV